ncbi:MULTISPECIES: SRPBCC family protein [Halomonadaceae]|uniref:SRPBCC family protein n=1 Tax=Vreelandella halophila TaxID=86177 RepID=A0A9X4YEA9_9GAMM|nr:MULTISPECIES: SRPBCC family protein [Halomonas]MYL28097.1 SRPBCC family protein [Halomonas utahensis]MYL75736.1 SRPBCC family protein [Halomonas sp. 22501_18_FS]
MQTIVVERTINAPIEQVFDLLSDHANYKQFDGIRDSWLVKEGPGERNGNGAVRRIDLGAVWFEEEISNFHRPTSMDYRILRSRPPIEHESGEIRLEETEQGTRVTWTSVFRIRIPVVGRVLSPLAAKAGTKAFGSMLKAIDRRLAKHA